MAPTLETKITNHNSGIEIVTDVCAVDKNDLRYSKDDTRKELEKDSREHKESSSTQTSSASSLLHKRKTHCYYGAFYKPITYGGSFLNRPKKNIPSSTTQKILSVKFLRVKQLQSELTEAQKRIADLQEENRTLRNIQKRQEISLKKYEAQESYLPQLMKSHEEETRVLTIKYKKLRNSYNDLESRHNKQSTELNNMKDRHKHLLQISQDKHLLQREQLAKQIEEMKINVNDLRNKIKFQSRKLDLETKNFKYQLSTEMNKNKILQEQLKQSHELVQKLQSVLKEKERYMANCKINQHIVNKMNQLKLKISTNKNKTFFRACSDQERENKYYDETYSTEKEITENSLPDGDTTNTKETTTTENTFNDFDFDSDYKTDFARPNNTFEDAKKENHYSFENNFVPPIINGNKTFSPPPPILPRSSINEEINVQKTESPPLSSYFERKSSISNDRQKNEPDVNTATINERSSFAYDSSSEVKNGNYFPELGKSAQEKRRQEQTDSNSEKSDDYKFPDETVSWLEFHEKAKKDENRKYNSEKLTDSVSVGVSYTLQRHNDSPLPYDKKSALLSALREIDLETQTTVGFGTNEKAFSEEKNLTISKRDKSHKTPKTRF